MKGAIYRVDFTFLGFFLEGRKWVKHDHPEGKAVPPHPGSAGSGGLHGLFLDFQL